MIFDTKKINQNFSCCRYFCLKEKIEEKQVCIDDVKEMDYDCFKDLISIKRIELNHIKEFSINCLIY